MPAPLGILRDRISLEGGFCQNRPERHKVTVEANLGMPACDTTKCLCLDATIKAQASKTCKYGDKSLARLQTLLLDAVGLLTSLLEQGQKGRLTPKAAADAATQALRFLGNANVAISHERRRRVADCLNRDLCPRLEKEDRFREVAPYLFGKEFERSAKDHIDPVKSLRKMTQPQSQSSSMPFFSAGPPLQSGYSRGWPLQRRQLRKRPLSPIPRKRKQKRRRCPQLTASEAAETVDVEVVYVHPINLFCTCMHILTD